MKILAIASKTAAWTHEQFEKLISREARHTLQLYLDGKIEQFWSREKAQYASARRFSYLLVS